MYLVTVCLGDMCICVRKYSPVREHVKARSLPWVSSSGALYHTVLDGVSH